jgi:hypothetical protein
LPKISNPIKNVKNFTIYILTSPKNHDICHLAYAEMAFRIATRRNWEGLCLPASSVIFIMAKTDRFIQQFSGLFFLTDRFNIGAAMFGIGGWHPSGGGI